MKRLLSRSGWMCILALSLVLTSCRSAAPVLLTQTQAQIRYVDRVSTDYRHDSIYILDSTVIYKDSLIERWRTRNRFRTQIMTDTLHQIDSIYFDRRITTTQVVYKQTWLQRQLTLIGLLTLLTLVGLASKVNWKQFLINILKLKK